MALFERLIGRQGPGEDRIGAISFGAAMSELIRGKLTVAQLEAAFSLDAGEQAEFGTLVGWANTLAGETEKLALSRIITEMASIGERLANEGTVMTGAPQLTIASVPAGDDTITRDDAGSFVADGFAVGQSFRLTTVPGNVGPNDGIFVISGGAVDRIDVAGDLLTNETAPSGAILERVLYATKEEARQRVIDAVNDLGGTAP